MLPAAHFKKEMSQWKVLWVDLDPPQIHVEDLTPITSECGSVLKKKKKKKGLCR